jgi:hypothetical protein
VIPKFLKRIAKKVARRVRAKGAVAHKMSRPGRNFQGVTAVDLWQRSFRFRETPAARAGVKRQLAREKSQRPRKGFFRWKT